MKGAEVEGWINDEILDLGVSGIASMFEYIVEGVNGGLLLRRAKVEQIKHPVLVDHGIIQATQFWHSKLDPSPVLQDVGTCTVVRLLFGTR